MSGSFPPGVQGRLESRPAVQAGQLEGQAEQE